MAATPLTTTPVAADRWLRWMIHLAWIAPALIIVAATLYQIVVHPQNTAPMLALRGIACLLWVVFASLPAWRGTLLDLGRLLLARARFVPLVLVTAVTWLIAASRPLDSGWTGAGAALSLFTVAAGYVEWRGNRKHLLFTLAILALNLLLLVPVDRVVGALIVPLQNHNDIFAEHDSLLGWKLRPGTAVTRRNDLYTSRETINPMGFRTPRLPAPKPPGTKRVLFLGDSHTESYTVNDDEMYPVLVERALADSLKVEVAALGVGGFSTDQELLTYLHYGRQYQPDLVVLQFCSNDVLFNVLDHYWRGRKPVFERFGDVLMLSGVPVPNFRDTGLFDPAMLQRSSLVLLLETALRQAAIKKSVKVEADSAEAWRVTALLLRDLDRVVRSDGARLVVFQADREPETEAKLRAVLKELSIPYLETSAAYTDPFDSYWVAGHWNQKGARAVASVLAPELRPYLE